MIKFLFILILNPVLSSLHPGESELNIDQKFVYIIAGITTPEAAIRQKGN
jgi:hypothetical protein